MRPRGMRWHPRTNADRHVDGARRSGPTIDRPEDAAPMSAMDHAASLAICGALESPGLLEVQFDETPLFDTLVGGRLAAPDNGKVSIPGGPGLGVTLDAMALRELPSDIVVIE